MQTDFALLIAKTKVKQGEIIKNGPWFATYGCCINTKLPKELQKHNKLAYISMSDIIS
jgi:hypothetical protein